jgi:hypothetical protein
MGDFFGILHMVFDLGFGIFRVYGFGTYMPFDFIF